MGSKKPQAPPLSLTDTHTVTIYMRGNAQVSATTNDPDKVHREVTHAIDSYYQPRWFRRRMTSLGAIGKLSSVVIPIANVLYVRIEPVRPSLPKPTEPVCCHG